VSTIIVLDALHEVNYDLLVGAPIFQPNNLLIARIKYLMVLNFNGLLCDEGHIKVVKEWKLLSNLVQCGKLE
jgi:hypothetical protein